MPHWFGGDGTNPDKATRCNARMAFVIWHDTELDPLCH